RSRQTGGGWRVGWLDSIDQPSSEPLSPRPAVGTGTRPGPGRRHATPLHRNAMWGRETAPASTEAPMSPSRSVYGFGDLSVQDWIQVSYSALEHMQTEDRWNHQARANSERPRS